MTAHETDLAFALLAATKAGERLDRLRQCGRWEGKIMGDVGDQAADGYLQGLILGRYPEDGLLSEETISDTDRTTCSRAWIVDPLDGTKEYSAGRHDWAVHVALAIDGQPVLGAVSLPTQGRLLWGVCAPGEERSGLEGTARDEGVVLRHGSDSSAERLRVAVSRSHTPEWVERFAEEMNADLIPAGSVGNKVCMLLTGEADLYVHQIGLKEWDTCAPECIARSLGWHVSKLRGEAHLYNREDPHNHELVVCPPALQGQVLAAIAVSGALGS
ncbi:MAG TPA: 3'(2'),5'-bisphosphate nucleotidase CysQ [Planctomycetes bacterium]|nr:3'(2'),5'-bisphosphate nucleotidase CysQ [Planctomycetota bacterium]HIL36697.1 3'(2'),5'-bisphosphate nucleotidase CysQ [Planctomycetota bacterium]